MTILNRPISAFSFNDIVAFCDEGNVEGVQLDYKVDVPKNLAKHFASFSNTRGGVIIIGVEEDKKNGKPKTYEGIKDDGKVIDRIHQFASNVNPRPRYELHRSENHKSGNMFILIKIYEGDKTPYYVQNDPHIYIRTGNISDPIEQAGPEIMELLFNKREKAKLARNVWSKKSEDVFLAAIRKSVRDREREIRIANPDDFKQKLIELKPMGINRPIFHFSIQPYYPFSPFCTPIEIKERATEYRAVSRFLGDFPEMNLDPIQDGVLSMEWNCDGLIDFHQLYSYGLIRRDRTLDEHGDRNDSIYLQHIVAYLYVCLAASSNFYSLFGYQGALIGELKINGLEGVQINKIAPNNYLDFLGKKVVGLLDEYIWPIEVETRKLQDSNGFQKFFIELINQIYWSFGSDYPSIQLLKVLFQEMGWHWTD